MNHIKSVDYVIGFLKKGQNGKNKGTENKIKAFNKNKKVNVNIFDVYKYSLTNIKFIQLFSFEIKYFLFSLFRPSLPDIIFSRGLLYFGTFLVSKIFSIPVIYEVHSNFYDEAKLLYTSKIKIFLFYIYEIYCAVCF